MVGDAILVSRTPPCLKEKPRICGKYTDAIIEFDMNFFERLYYYGPFRVKYLNSVFSEDVKDAIATRGTSVRD